MTKQLIVIKTLATAQLLHELLDELEDTPYYSGPVKIAAKKMHKTMGIALDKHIDHLFGIDDMTMNGVVEGISCVVRELSSMDPAKIAAIGEMLKSGEIVYTPME